MKLRQLVNSAVILVTAATMTVGVAMGGNLDKMKMQTDVAGYGLAQIGQQATGNTADVVGAANQQAELNLQETALKNGAQKKAVSADFNIQQNGMKKADGPAVQQTAKFNAQMVATNGPNQTALNNSNTKQIVAPNIVNINGARRQTKAVIRGTIDVAFIGMVRQWQKNAA